MTRLPMVSPKMMVRALKHAGFVEQKQKGSHLYLKHSVRNLRTTVPIHTSDLKRPLVRRIMEQAGLTEAQLRRLL